jgi:hypothetical protein
MPHGIVKDTLITFVIGYTKFAFLFYTLQIYVIDFVWPNFVFIFCMPYGRIYFSLNLCSCTDESLYRLCSNFACQRRHFVRARSLWHRQVLVAGAFGPFHPRYEQAYLFYYENVEGCRAGLYGGGAQVVCHSCARAAAVPTVTMVEVGAPVDPPGTLRSTSWGCAWRMRKSFQKRKLLRVHSALKFSKLDHFSPFVASFFFSAGPFPRRQRRTSTALRRGGGRTDAGGGDGQKETKAFA